MQDEEQRPQQYQVKHTNKPKEELHVHFILVPDPPLHHRHIQTVDDSTQKRHRITNRNLRGRLVWERPSALVAPAGQIHGRDEHDPNERGPDPEKLGGREALYAEQGAEYKRPYTARRREDRDARDARVLETCRGEVVCQEPEHAELEAQNGRLAETQLILLQ